MRESGILMHITSLPGPHGVGTMGKAAHDFVDFLADAGQSWWQILPLTPTGYGDSPYQSCSTFAGNPYLIDLETLVKEGLLEEDDLAGITWAESETRVDFGAQYNNRIPVLRKAFARFAGSAEFDQFLATNSNWLPDFALFMALKGETGGKPWLQWDRDLKFREPDAMWNARRRLADEIRFQGFVQFLFDKQWRELRAHAAKKGISIIGDVPIYVPLDSVEVWASPELFQLDRDRNPEKVAGVPPDYFSEDGQLWGNPLYDWPAHASDGYGWWIRRLRAAGERYDMVRLDHFRGFEAYWAVPYGEKTARNGAWIPGPGLEFIRTIQQALPKLKFIAEDLGLLTPEVLKLRDDSGLPGMRVLEFAFDTRAASDYQPHRYIPNAVCYTGTHDNMTMQQWFDTAPADAVAFATEYMALTEQEGLVWGAIRTAMSSVAKLCIVPLQDVLALGAAARMNFPGTMTSDNWTWRLADGQLTPALAKKLRTVTERYERLAK